MEYYNDYIKIINFDIFSNVLNKGIDVNFNNENLYSLYNTYLCNNTVDLNPVKGKSKCYQEIEQVGLPEKKRNSSSENQKNDIKLCLFNEYTPIFLSLLKDTNFEDGYENPAVSFFKNMLNENYAIAFIWINNLYIENIDNEDVIQKILRILSFLNYDEKTMASFPIIAANAIMTGSDNVKEAAIMAFESWRTPKCLDLLRKIEVEKEWLKSYLHQVIDELEQEASVC